MIPVFTILLSLIFGILVIALLGKNPLQAYYNLLQGSGLAPKASYAGHKGMITDFTSFLNALTPMLFAALAVLIALKAGLFNIGVSGQMLAAGFTATVLIGYSDLPAVIAKPLVVLIGFLIGALAGGLVGFLKHRFNINEVVSTIMFNYIFQNVISFLINTFYVDPVSRQSRNVGQAGRLTLVDVVVGDYKMDIPLGILVAVIGIAVTAMTAGNGENFAVSLNGSRLQLLGRTMTVMEFGSAASLLPQSASRIWSRVKTEPASEASTSKSSISRDDSATGSPPSRTSYLPKWISKSPVRNSSARWSGIAPSRSRWRRRRWAFRRSSSSSGWKGFTR